MSADGGEGYQTANSDAPETAEEFKKKWDAKTKSWYYMSSATGDSYWAVPEDEEWMEVLDEASQCIYHRHYSTGETKWPDTSEPLTVWEELKCPITQQHYYFSNTSQSAQWEPPRWVDYVDPDSGEVYFYNAETDESVWERPDDFVEEATDEAGAEEEGQEVEMMMMDPVTSSRFTDQGELPAATPRFAPLPQTMPQGQHEAGKRAADSPVEVSVAYSLSKRPRNRSQHTPQTVAPMQSLSPGGRPPRIDVSEATSPTTHIPTPPPGPPPHVAGASAADDPPPPPMPMPMPPPPPTQQQQQQQQHNQKLRGLQPTAMDTGTG